MNEPRQQEARRRLGLSVLVGALAALLLAISLESPEASPDGVEFLGYEPPGTTPERFAPEILTAENAPHSKLSFSPRQRQVLWSAYFGEAGEAALTSTFDGQGLSVPSLLPFAGEYINQGPTFSDDGRRVFFASNRSPSGPSEHSPRAIWRVEKAEAGWGAPTRVDSTYAADWFAGNPSLSRNGNLYFSARVESEPRPRLYRSALQGGEYGQPRPLDGRIRVSALDPYVGPEERFILFSAPGKYGVMDLYVSFREANGRWGKSINLAKRTGTNPDFFDRFPSLSRDGEHLFFVRAIGDQFPGDDAHFYWVSAEAFKPRKKPKGLRVAAAAGVA